MSHLNYSYNHIISGGDAYTAVAVAKKVGTGSWTVYNIFRDHLGSITHLKTGSTVTEYSFDAWGRRRDKDDWTMTLISEPALFADRGFTAHEYLEDFKLYNMNGRLYDPVVGRFLSADPVIQDPENTQSYNRYSYCLNNPLKYIDPSGNTWWSKFWNWTAENGIQFGNNIGPGGSVPNISAPGPGNTRVAAGVNTKTGQVGVGNNSSGFMNFYFPGYNYDVAAQNFVNKTLPSVRGQYGAEWRATEGGGLSRIDLQGGKVITQMVDWFVYINRNKGINPYTKGYFNVGDIIDATSTPKKHWFSEIFSSTTNDGVRGTSYFGDIAVGWYVVDRNFMDHYKANYISYIYGDSLGVYHYQIRAMYKNETRISLKFYDYELYKSNYKRIFP